MAHYIKVTQEVADAIGVTSIRNKTPDGCVLLWQADTLNFPGMTLEERVDYCGGKILTAQQAKAETDGVEYPAIVYTPVAFGGTGKPDLTKYPWFTPSVEEIPNDEEKPEDEVTPPEDEEETTTEDTEQPVSDEEQTDVDEDQPETETEQEPAPETATTESKEESV